jgi:putative peptide zinc metalloprotease protein
VESLYNPSWYHVATLRPRVSAQVRFHRHVYRGEVWYVIQNPTTGRVHRLTPTAHALVMAMNGERTAQEIWDAALSKLGDDAPTQEETIWVMGLLYMADVLRCDVPPDTAELFRRAQERDEKERRSKLNPISFRVPLLDPDAFLTRFKAWAAPCFSRAGVVVWCVVVGIAGLLAIKHAPELAAGARSLLEPQSFVAFWFAYPFVKVLHELGHAFSVKRWGGEVHEIGILFLVFMPVPYVDASASSVFVGKRRRMAVGAAGIAVELFLAALALFVWLAVEPGWVRHVAYAVMLVGGVSTLLFNGNPLLRFDGYYVLADWLEIPNLASKANQYLAAVSKRFLLGMRQVQSPDTTPREAAWLAGYAVASFVYRIGVLFGIALYLASDFFIVGVALAVATLIFRVAFPLLRQLSFVLTDPTVGERRGRALTGSLGLLGVVATLLITLPIPLRTRAEGVIWLPEQSTVRAGADGFVEAVLVVPHSRVEAGQPLIQTRDPSIEARVLSLEARARELRARLLALDPLDRVATEGASARLEDAEAELMRALDRAGDVLMRSPADGVFVVAGGANLLGHYVRQGEVVAYVVDLAKSTARVVVRQEDAAVLRERTSAAWVRLDHDLGTVLPARIVREVPTATDRLPTAALGTAGGGPFAVDPMDPDGLKTLDRVFQFDLALPAGTAISAAGERVHVRFDHDAEPVARRAYRSLRRLFLRQLGV